MREVQSNYSKSQNPERTVSRSEVLCGSMKFSGARRRDQSLFSFLLEIQSRLGTEGLNDQIEEPKQSNEKDRQRSTVYNLSRYCE
jgi:hypothetical protein